jgi:hypothetical protein
MALDIYGDFTTDTVWYDIQATETSYIYDISGLGSKNIATIRAYSKSGAGTPIITVVFLTALGTPIITFTTADPDTGSSNNYSEIVTAIPATAAKIGFSTTTAVGAASFVSVDYTRLTVARSLNPTLYTNSQTIFIEKNSAVALLGGGAGGGGWNSGNTWNGGGGGSGRITYGNVAGGANYVLTIGSGGFGGSSGNNGLGGTGGTTTFGTLNAAGGSPGASANLGSYGGAGGSGGAGGGGQNSLFGINGGFNGNSGDSGQGSAGSGSGVAANFFVSPASARGLGTPSNASGSTGGGIYAGGGGGAGNVGRGGGSANGRGGGGGGGSYSEGGGSGAAGALYVLEL